MKSTLISIGILVIALFAFALIYEYPAIAHLLPKGAHIWRQSDCWAMTLNYQQNGYDFLTPSVYNLQSENGQVAGEFPLFYYMAATFPKPEIALRIIHSVLLICGIIASYFVAFYFLQRRLLAIFCSLLLFTSPLLIFYGNNFLSDVPALSFAFIGWAFFFNVSQKYRWQFIAFLFFAIATLLKASQAINFGIAFFFMIKNKQLSFKNALLFLWFLVPMSWYIYAKQYNAQHDDQYYFLSVYPIWKLTFYEIGLVLWRLFVSWNTNFFWRPFNILLLIAAYYYVLHRKRLNPDLRSIVEISFAFAILYLILFYQKMIAHEYYYCVFFVFILFYIIGILKTYNVFHAENIFAHTFLFLLLLPNLYFCRAFIQEKLTYSAVNQTYYDEHLQDFLQQHHVNKNKTVLSLPDESPNKTLSLLQRKGYTDFNPYLQKIKENKIDFILIEKTALAQYPNLKPHLQHHVDTFHNLILFQLR